MCLIEIKSFKGIKQLVFFILKQGCRINKYEATVLLMAC